MYYCTTFIPLVSRASDRVCILHFPAKKNFCAPSGGAEIGGQYRSHSGSFSDHIRLFLVCWVTLFTPFDHHLFRPSGGSTKIFLLTFPSFSSCICTYACLLHVSCSLQSIPSLFVACEHTLYLYLYIPKFSIIYHIYIIYIIYISYISYPSYPPLISYISYISYTSYIYRICIIHILSPN